MALEQAATVEAEPTHRFVEVEGLKLHYLDWGGDPKKRTFLLLHGGAAHAHWWDGVAPLLTLHGRVLALDFRGHGESDWPRPAHYGPPAYVRDVVGLIKELKSKVVLVGHSMGGAVSQWVAVQHPELLEALIVVDAPHGPPPIFRRLMWRWRRRARGGKRPELKSSDDIIRKFRLNPPDTYMSKEDSERLALHGARQLPSGNWVFRFDPETRAWRRDGVRSTKPRLKKLSMPVLVLRGDRSTLVSRAHARRMQRKIRGAVYKEIARAYHHVPLDNPGDTAREIAAFVERTD